MWWKNISKVQIPGMAFGKSFAFVKQNDNVDSSSAQSACLPWDGGSPIMSCKILQLEPEPGKERQEVKVLVPFPLTQESPFRQDNALAIFGSLEQIKKQEAYPESYKVQ